MLRPGATVDRYGCDGGTSVAPVDTEVGARSLRPGTTDKPFSVFEVTRRLPVESGTTAPWFGQAGLGTQYRLPASVGDLVNAGYLRVVK